MEFDVRLVAFSDTHRYHKSIILPDGDVAVHAGDYSSYGDLDELQSFAKWFGKQPHARKLVVNGNHDQWADINPEEANQIFTDNGIECIDDLTVNIDGFDIHGYPWTPEFGWTQGHMRSRAVLHQYTQKIPECDVLVSHGPPVNILDNVHGMPVGCSALLDALHRVRPRVFLCGHIHTCAGGFRRLNWTDRQATLCYNVSYCVDGPQRPSGNPIRVLDVERDSLGVIEVIDQTRY